MNNPPFHFCKICGTKYYKRVNVSRKNWDISQFCSRKCTNTKRVPYNKGKEMANIVLDYVHPMQGKKHTEEAKLAIKEKRAKQVMSQRQLDVLKLGGLKEWTPELRQKLSDAAKRRGLGKNTEWTEERRKIWSERAIKLGLGNLRGSDHPSWKGGKRHNLKRRVTGKDVTLYRGWRRAVLERDGSTCQICHKAAEHVHHILPWVDYPSMRYNLDNGISLCASCHRKEHKLTL